MKLRSTPLVREYLTTEYRGVEDIIRKDEFDLKQVNGSFEDIADRLEQILYFAASLEFPRREQWGENVGILLDMFESQYGHPHNWDAGTRELYIRMRYSTIADLPGTHLDEYVVVVDVVHTTAAERCIDQDCQFPPWREKVRIYNHHTGRRLSVSKGMEHMVRKHRFLIKGMDYGITAGDFYEQFMYRPKEKRELNEEELRGGEAREEGELGKGEPIMDSESEEKEALAAERRALMAVLQAREQKLRERPILELVVSPTRPKRSHRKKAVI